MSVSQTTTFVGIPKPILYRDLVFGAESIDAGIIDIITDERTKVPMNRWVVAAQKSTAPQDEPSTTVNASTKDEKLITTGERELYDEFKPSEFNDDWKFLHAMGSSAQDSFAQPILDAIFPGYAASFNSDVEEGIWQGNTGSGSPWLARHDGYLKIMDADGTVNDLAVAGAITSANVIAILNGMINTLPAVVLKENPFIVLNHTDFRLYHEATLATDHKGQDFNEKGFTTFRGFRLVPVSGIPAGRLCFTHGGNLKASTWMRSDLDNVVVDRLQANSRLWFIKLLAELGVNYLFGKEVALYKTA